MRECEGNYIWLNPDTGKYEEKKFELGYFHCYGVDYEEFESGPAMYSTAIVELPDGQVINTQVCNIKFKKPYSLSRNKKR